MVIHVHCRFAYYSAPQRDTIARCAARAKVGVTPAEFSTADMRTRFPAISWHTVHNGIDTCRYHPITETERAQWRSSRCIPPDVPLIAFVGRLERAKGVDVLREFCALAASAGLAVLVQFLATGASAVFRGYRSIASELASKFPGHVYLCPDSDLRSDRLIRYCDALLHPSLSEVAPLVALEALRSGVPVIGTRCTPFYDELLALGIDKKDCVLVDLPATVDLTLERAKLAVDFDVARWLACEMLKVAASMSLRGDRERNRTSERIGSTRLTLDGMLNRLHEVYSSAIMSFNTDALPRTAAARPPLQVAG